MNYRERSERRKKTLRLEPLESRHLLAAQPILSEIVASNSDSLLDGNGNSSDWIELLNRGDTAIDFHGWHLTDDIEDLSKWSFPSVTLEPGEYLVVFASGDDEPDAAGNLHTNFRLGSGGEYLALVEPDGTTVADEFRPEYPPQIRDVSYGLELEATVSQIAVENGDSLKWTVPSGPIANWTDPAFDDAAWAAGDTGVGFENLDDIGLPDGLVSFFGFDEQSASDTTLELVGGNQETIVGVGSFADGQHGNAIDFDGDSYVPVSQNPTGMRDSFTVAAWIQPDASNRTIVSQLAGNARQGFWFGYNSGGPWLTMGAGASANAGANGSFTLVRAPNAIPELGQWNHVAVTFDSADSAEEVKFYVNGQKLTSGVTGANVADGQMGDPAGLELRIGRHNNGTFPFDGRMDEVAIFDRPLSEFEINSIATNGVAEAGPVLGNEVATDIENEMLGSNSSAYLRLPFEITGTAELDSLSLEMKYNDGFVAYLNGTEVARDGIAGAVSWNSSAAERDPVLATSYEVFDISQHLGLLVDGDANVLAIQGLNSFSSDTQFLVSPRLIAADVSEAVQYFPDPSPGAPNANGVSGLVEDTNFSETRGFFDAPFQLEISTETEGAEIRYTTDGSDPTESNGDVYSGPIEIATTTTIRAAAFKNGYLPTNVDTQTYLFLEDVIRQPALPEGLPSTWGNYYIGPTGSAVPADYEMNQTIIGQHEDTIINDLQSIPTLSIVMDHEDLFDVGDGLYPNPFINREIRERPTSIEWIDPNGPDWQVDAGMRLFGGWSRHFHATPKKSFALRFRGEYGQGRLDVPLFANNQVDSKIEGASDFDTVLLRGVFSDAWPDAASPPQYLRDYNARLTQLAMGQPSSHGTWVHLYLNGVYWGIYNPSERPDADFAASYGGGDAAEYDAVKHAGLCGPGCATNNQFEVIDGGDAAREGFQAALNLARSGLADQENYEAFKGLVDVANLADYILLQHYIGNVDWPHKNWYANRKREGGDGWKFYAWDSEYTLRNTTDSRLASNNANTPAELWNAARQNEEFRAMFADRVHRHMFNDGALQPAANIARYSAIAAEIEGAIKAEAARWGDNGATRQGATNFDFGDWSSVRDGIIDGFFPQRHAVALSQLRSAGLYPNVDAPEFNQFGGTVDVGFELTMSGPGTIFYTTDGSDPRGDTIPQLVETRTLFTQGDATTAFIPRDDSLATDWTGVTFDDSAWLTGTTGVGYERSNSNPLYAPLLGLDLLSEDFPAEDRIDVDGNGTNDNASVYLRIPFEMTGEISEYDFLNLKMKYDDGFVAYLNGIEVARAQAPANVAWNSSATSDHPDTAATSFETFNISSHTELLQSGSNVLAIHGLNANLTSSDMLIIPELVIGMTDQNNEQPPAIEYSGPIVVNDNVHIKARTLNGAEWSALTEATFIAEAIPPVRVTEIMYNPVGATDTEFIEVQNTGDETISLDGVRFSDGIEFTFGDINLEPGERTVVVSDLVAFEAQYGPDVNVAGQFEAGGLSNAGEQIALVDAFERAIMEFRFDDDWFSITDGIGFSLTISDPNANIEVWNDSESWRPSSVPGGTPGSDDFFTLPSPQDILFNEVLANTSLGETQLELWNTTNAPIDISHWFLSDDRSNPQMVQLPPSTTIPANGYLTLTETAHFGQSVDAINGFSLSKFGGELSLTAGTADNLLAGFQAARNYSASEPGVSLGVIATSDGRTDFSALSSTTFGAENSPPLVGPIVINEVMYNPIQGDDEYIELLNVSNDPVSLFDVGAPEKTWQLDGAVSFAFPTGVQLAPGEYLLITPIGAQDFRSKYAISESVTILGPYSGSLDNGGESVRLEKLGEPTADGAFAEILVDRVQYRDSLPWPVEADGNGPSLERLDSVGYGNEPTNWMRSAFGGSPGSRNVGIDTSPPSMPIGVRAEDTGPSEARLTWSPAVDAQSDVVQYKIYRNDVLIGSTNGPTTSYQDLERPGGMASIYRVVAVNGDGVDGLPSRGATVAGYQDGLSPGGAYLGTIDTILTESDATANYATDATLLVSNDNPEGTGQKSVALLRWDLTDIHSGSEVQSTSITVNLTASTGQNYNVYAATTPWVESEVNWNQAANGQPWSAPGASGPLDRSADLLGTVGPSGTSLRTIQLNDEGITQVQSWVDGTTDNHGFILVPASETPPHGGANFEDLIAFYNFDDLDDDTATDFSNNGLHGTTEGIVQFDPDGFNGGAYRFNGNGHVEAPININPGVQPRLTMGAWVKTDPVTPGLYKIIGHDNGGWDRTIGLDNRQGAFRWTSFVGNRRPVTPTVEPVVDQWSFVAAAYDNVARTVTVYVDIDAMSTDDEVLSFTEPTSFNNGQNTVSIGSLRPDNFAEGFLGLMDNVFFFSDVLSAEEIDQLRTSGAGFFAEGGLTFDSSDAIEPATRPTITVAYREPTTLGDITGDGLVDATDIDAICQGIQAGSSASLYDVDGNSNVDRADISHLVETIVGTRAGDANLDGRVDASDLNQVGIRWQQEDASFGWASGDFNCDFRVDVADLNTIGLSWQSGVAAARAVPRAALVVQVGVDEANQANDANGVIRAAHVDQLSRNNELADSESFEARRWKYRQDHLSRRTVSRGRPADDDTQHEDLDEWFERLSG